MSYKAIDGWIVAASDTASPVSALLVGRNIYQRRRIESQASANASCRRVASFEPPLLRHFGTCSEEELVPGL
jgi:hypothetical protein